MAKEARHGTAIAAIRTPNKVVIAADSKAVDAQNRPKPDDCKIKQVGDLFFAFHGLVEDKSTNFNAQSIATQALSTSGTVADKLTTFEGFIMEPLRKTLERIRQEEPAAYQRNCIDMAPMGLIVCAIENEVLTLYSRKFVVTASSSPIDIRIERGKCPGPNCPNGIGGVFVPETDPRFDWKTDVVKAAHDFVQMKINEKPSEIGPPIAILEVSKTGAHWIEQGVCPDIKQENRGRPK